jgi:hypothetical protein
LRSLTDMNNETSLPTSSASAFGFRDISCWCHR